MSESTLRITEIFCSLQGETRTVGLPTVFIRLTGCPMRCVYCDTSYSFYGGETVKIDDIMAQTAGYGAKHVTVTGGEPLAQKRCFELLTRLCDEGYEVSVETGGAMDISCADPRACMVLDIKTPASGELAKNRWENIEYLKANDQVKFVICDRQDYEWSRMKIEELALHDRVDEILFSPIHGQLDARELAEWILRDKLQVRFQLQLHKILWDDAQGR
ncbi:7-carboxy-7-deazaguanine synthase QueE [Oceanospirillum beijerinckii]|uniref:7-carboxy-7-deazaguanine synthase QueE n=1 Tax=Oceanospirillum beijerinckii TaxID=64976 RepID=UPI00041020FE|nr:7-carboxy-7-deazaguanine synthase QueE [Oceanospirillum beijerinckii]